MPSQRIYKTEGIVLRHIDFGEADRILTIMTPTLGKIHAIAKGSRKVTSKLASQADLLQRTQFVMAQGRELDVVTQGETAERFDALRTSLWHGTAAYTVAEILDRTMEDRAEHHSIYQLALDTLRRLDLDARQWLADPRPENQAGPQARGWAALRHFEMVLLDDLGYRPAFQQCTMCEREIQPVENGFNAELGGVICPNCLSHSQRRLPLLTLKVLRLIQRTAWTDLPVMRLDSSTLHDVEGVMQSIMTRHLERSLRSWAILNESR